MTKNMGEQSDNVYTDEINYSETETKASKSMGILYDKESRTISFGVIDNK